MDKAEQSIVLEYLADGRIDEAWPLFLRCYSPHVLQIVNRFVRNDDDKSECFLYVCERLHRRDCRRLKKFDPTGPAIFTTWLHAVVYNLCRDWYRTRFPRFQPFRSVAKLPEFDQRVFRFHYELKLSLAETYEHLRVTLPDITRAQVQASAALLQNKLSVRQRRLLQVRRPKIDSLSSTASDGLVMLDLPASGREADPEADTNSRQLRDRLGHALATLERSEILLLRLRFERDMTYAEIARFMGFKNSQEADRHIVRAIDKLRRIVNTLSDGKPDK